MHTKFISKLTNYFVLIPLVLCQPLIDASMFIFTIDDSQLTIDDCLLKVITKYQEQTVKSPFYVV